MNERMRVRISRNGAELPVTRLGSDGVELAFETSARPLGFAVLLAPANDIVRARLARVRQVEDWAPHEIRLTVVKDDGQLLLTGGGKRQPDVSLPPGRYVFEFALSETKFANARREIEIPENGEVVIELEDVTVASRVVVVDREQWDDEARAVCVNPESRIDGMDPFGWLGQLQPRKARKACFLNLLAKARSLPAMRRGESLCSLIESVRWADVDRIAVAARPQLVSRLESLPGWPDTGLVDPVHGDRLARLFGGSAEDYEVRSFREPRSFHALQVVTARQKTTGAVFAELDIDLGNPRMDLAGFVLHAGELIHPDRTNHLKLYDDLVAPLGDVLYYRIEEAQVQPA